MEHSFENLAVISVSLDGVLDSEKERIESKIFKLWDILSADRKARIKGIYEQGNGEFGEVLKNLFKEI